MVVIKSSAGSDGGLGIAHSVCSGKSAVRCFSGVNSISLGVNNTL